MKWRCSCVSCSCCMHSEDSRQTMETFAPVAGHLEIFTLRIREEINAAYEAPCFCLYIASLKLLFICLNLFICLFITCLILKKIILKLVRPISILWINKPITIGFTSPCIMTHYFFMKQFGSNRFVFGFASSNPTPLCKNFPEKSFASSQIPKYLNTFGMHEWPLLSKLLDLTSWACLLLYWARTSKIYKQSLTSEKFGCIYICIKLGERIQMFKVLGWYSADKTA